jgi:hypothetical protein
MIVGVGAVLVCVLLYCLGVLFIQAIALVLYVSLLPVILIAESKNKAFGSTSNLAISSKEERWSRAKSELDKLEDKAKKTTDQSEKQLLLGRKLYLENELRQLQWEISESEMTEIYNASKGRLTPVRAKVDSEGTASGDSSSGKSSKSSEGKQNKYLSKILRNTREVMEKEPEDSLRISLSSIANDVKAHYYVLNRDLRKKAFEVQPMRDEKPREIVKSASVVSDYWVCWAALQSLAKKSDLRKENLLKYASENFRPEFSKFLTYVSTKSEKNEFGHE